MTTMVAISLFYNRVRPAVPKCPTVALISYTRDAAIKFCEKSRYWREDLTAMNAVASQAAYTASPPSSESVVVDVVTVRHNGISLEQTSEAYLDSLYSDWRDDTASQADGWFATARDNISLYKAPSAAGTANIELKAVLKPSKTATTLAQPLYDHYLEEIAAGAKATLLAMPDMPWSNPGEVAYYKDIFDKAIADAKITAAKGYNRTPLRTRPPPF